MENNDLDLLLAGACRIATQRILAGKVPIKKFVPFFLLINRAGECRMHSVALRGATQTAAEFAAAGQHMKQSGTFAYAFVFPASWDAVKGKIRARRGNPEVRDGIAVIATNGRDRRSAAVGLLRLPNGAKVGVLGYGIEIVDPAFLGSLPQLGSA